MLFFSQCSKQSDIVPQTLPVPETRNTHEICTKSIPLMAGQHTTAGSINISQDTENLYVRYVTTSGWKLLETHLFAAPIKQLPKSEKGVPEVGQFPYGDDHIAQLSTVTYTIPLSNFGNDSCIAIAAHASVGLVNLQGQVEKKETAWGNGSKLSEGDTWAMYISYYFCRSSDATVNDTINGNSNVNEGGN